MAATISRRSSGGNSSGSNGSPTLSRRPKRRNERNILTFYEKIAVIRYYDETNVSRNSLAKMFHCCATQIRRILERKQELLQQLATLSEADASIIIEEMTRKRRKFEMSAISFILYQWVERCRQLRLRKSITNETLKETALKMAAILNLPAFRPSYRWLNRFRGKYKYNDEDLGPGNNPNTIAGELSVEDIIIEYKDSLPSFMQKEISAITQSAKVEENLQLKNHETKETKRSEMLVMLNDNSLDDFEISDDDNEIETVTANKIANNNSNNNDNDDVVEVIESSNCKDPVCKEYTQKTNLTSIVNNKSSEPVSPEFTMNAGTSALLHSVFPHLAVIHQFALLNSDVKALELISKLGVHMQTQAAEGAYKQLSLAANTTNGIDLNETETNGDGIYPDIDDIVLIE
uniref:HTH CENPB-type domain-containing protein n=1 Tax=Glossina brevipalpis TaxID=37001 RepID=A0A1A9WTJ1_9MUSC